MKKFLIPKDIIVGHYFSSGENMAHDSQKRFCLSVKQRFPSKFVNCDVLDVGSMDINGNNRYLFEGNYTYIGLDLGPGNNVDVVCKGHEYKPGRQFDVVVSTECFEHDPFWQETLKALEALNIMKEKVVSVLPVINCNRKVIGIIHIHDLLNLE